MSELDDQFEEFMGMNNDERYEVVIEALATRAESFQGDSTEDKMARAILGSVRPLVEVAIDLDAIAKDENPSIMTQVFVTHMINTYKGLAMLDQLIALQKDN